MWRGVHGRRRPVADTALMDNHDLRIQFGGCDVAPFVLGAMIVASSASAPAEEASIGAELRELKAQQAALAAKIEALEARVATSATGQAESAASPPPILRLPSASETQTSGPTIQNAGEGFRVFGTAQITATFPADEPQTYTVAADQTAFGLEYRATAEGVPVRVLFEVTPQYRLELRRGFVEVGPVRIGQDFSATLNDAFVGEGVSEVNFTGNENSTSATTAGLIQTPMNVVQFRTGGFVFSYEVPIDLAGYSPSPFVAAARYDGRSGPLDWSIGAFADRIEKSEYGIGGSLGARLEIGRDDLRAYVIGGSGIGDVFGYYQRDSLSQQGDRIARVGGRVSYRHWWSQKVRSNVYYGYEGEKPYSDYRYQYYCCVSGGRASTYRVESDHDEENESIGINLIATFRPGLEAGIEGAWGKYYSSLSYRYILFSGPAYPGVSAATVHSVYQQETDRYFVFVRARY